MTASENENEKRETVADIVADIRERAYNATRHGERTTDNYAVSELLKSIADRIETAWKREREAVEADALAVGGIVEASRHKPGNAAALREALREAIGETCAGCKRDCDDCMNLKSGWMKKAKAAISAPARNCDIYQDKKDAEAAFISEECKHPCGNCTVNDEYGCALVHECGVDWLFATAERKGECDA